MANKGSRSPEIRVDHLWLLHFCDDEPDNHFLAKSELIEPVLSQAARLGIFLA